MSDEQLAKDEAYFRELSRSWTHHGARSDADALVRLLAEYDRLKGLEASHAWIQKVGPTWLHEGRGCEEREQDLARALPVVEAAGALVEHHEDIDGWTSGGHDALLDDLARAVRAAREPRMGEQG